MTPQNILQELNKIDFLKIQADDVAEHYILKHIGLELIKLEKEHIIHLLFKFIEADRLIAKYTFLLEQEAFKNMHEFRYVNDNKGTWITSKD